MRGYFGIGVEGISKPMNLGAIARTAHAFEASFVFSVAAATPLRELSKADTSDATESVPFYRFDSADDMMLPAGCSLVGVEITADAVDLPSFRHPRCAAYVLGPERGILSGAMLARCDHVVRIPTRFSINVGLAGALVMYDRLLTHGRFSSRPVQPGSGKAMPVPVFGSPA